LPQPLAGLRVIEVGGGSVSAASATKTFADYGADVVTVEPLTGGLVRRLPPFPEDAPRLDAGAFHLALNTGKRSIALDVETASGREVLTRLIRGAHLLVVEQPPALARRLLDLVPADGPSAVTISPHGLEGPYADRVENDASAFAWTTRMYLHATAGRPPLRYAPQLAAIQVGGTAAAVGAAAAWSTEHDGERRNIEVAAVEALSGNVDSFFITWSFNQVETPRGPGQSHIAYPAGNYRCKDGWVMFAASGPRFFDRLCQGIGHPELSTDPRFADPVQKGEHWDDFMTYLGPWLEVRTRHEVFTQLQGFGVMVAPTLEVSEVLTDPQAVARGSFVQLDQPGVGAITLAGAPFHLDEAWEVHPAPRLGQHTTALLDAAGYTRDEQIALFRAGVTG